MDKKKRERMGKRRRAFLIVVGYMSLALDKLEGKSTQPPQAVKRGRIKIVS